MASYCLKTVYLMYALQLLMCSMHSFVMSAIKVIQIHLSFANSVFGSTPYKNTHMQVKHGP